MEIKEFLTQKAGPLPYWAWGLLGVATIAGTVYLSRSGVLDSLTGKSGGEEAGGAGAGSGGVPPDATQEIVAMNQSQEGAGFSQLPLVGQQDGGTGGILSPQYAGGTGVFVGQTSPARAGLAPGAQRAQSALEAGAGSFSQRGTGGAVFRAGVAALTRQQAPGPVGHGINLGSIQLRTPIPTTQTQTVQFLARSSGTATV